MHGKRIEGVCIGLVAGYELASFASRGRLPTVTALVMRLPHRVRAAVVAGVWWWTVQHFSLLPRRRGEQVDFGAGDSHRSMTGRFTTTAHQPRL